MCLYKTYSMRVAEEDITCYKIIESHHLIQGGVRYQSYFQHTEITFGTPIKAANECSVEVLDTYTVLLGEVVHAYMSPDITKGYIDSLKEFTAWYSYSRSKTIDIVLIRCTIPKGTLYCNGTDAHLLDNYGALTIIPNEIIRVLATIHR